VHRRVTSVADCHAGLPSASSDDSILLFQPYILQRKLTIISRFCIGDKLY